MMIFSSFCFFIYEALIFNTKIFSFNGENKMLAGFKIPTFEREFVADIDTAELFIAENENGSDIVFIISRTRTSKHEFASRKYQEELERADGNPKRTNAVHAKIISESLLVSWKNVLNDNGEEVEPTTENKCAVLEKYPALISRIGSFASNVKNFKDKAVEGEFADSVLDSEEKKEEARGN